QPGLLGEIQSEVALEATPLLRFVLQNSRIIVSCIVALVAFIVAFGAWHWFTARVEREAQIELGHILIGAEGEPRIAALEKFLPSAPGAIRLGVQLEIAVTSLSVNALDKAAAAYGNIHAEDPKGALGLMAAINQADVLLRAKKPQEALTVLDALEKTVPENLRPSVHEAQAACAEQSGDFVRALAGYEAIVSSPGGDQMGYYKAKIAELKARLAVKPHTDGEK
ncbi:MAG: tetratricopeptide repeat protein, partial [Bilophila sp.]